MLPHRCSPCRQWPATSKLRHRVHYPQNHAENLLGQSVAKGDPLAQIDVLLSPQEQGSLQRKEDAVGLQQAQQTLKLNADRLERAEKAAPEAYLKRGSSNSARSSPMHASPKKPRKTSCPFFPRRHKTTETRRRGCQHWSGGSLRRRVQRPDPSGRQRLNSARPRILNRQPMSQRIQFQLPVRCSLPHCSPALLCFAA